MIAIVVSVIFWRGQVPITLLCDLTRMLRVDLHRYRADTLWRALAPTFCHAIVSIDILGVLIAPRAVITSVARVIQRHSCSCGPDPLLEVGSVFLL